MLEIEIHPEEVNAAKQFSENVVSTVTGYYQTRKQFDIDTIKYQTFIGKLGEFGARSWLVKNGNQCSEINLEVTNNKTFDPDIIIAGKTSCHVKSQDITSAKRFGTSWTFQYSALRNGHRDIEIFDKYIKDDLVIFCLVENPKVYICAMINVYRLHELKLFGEPRKQVLIGIKKVVYYDSIPPEYRIPKGSSS